MKMGNHKLLAALFVTTLGMLPLSVSLAKGPPTDPNPDTVCIDTGAAAVVAAECLSLISDTEAAVMQAYDDGAFSGRRALSNRDMLLEKLDEAYCKLSSGKYGDAIAKLQDFQANVSAWSDPELNKPKLSSEAGTALNASADAVIACINGL